MGQVGRTRYFARRAKRARCARRGKEKNKAFLFPSSSRASRSCRAPREISRSPRLAHKAPVMPAIRAKQAKVHFAYFVRRDQHGVIGKHLTWRKVLF